MFDTIILIFLGVFFIVGCFKGIIKQFFSIGAWIGGGLAAIFLSSSILKLIYETEEIDTTKRFLSYVIIFLVVFLLIKLIGHKLSKDTNKTVLGPFDRILGGVWNLAKALIIVSIVLFLLKSATTWPLIGEKVLKLVSFEGNSIGIAKYFYENNLLILIYEKLIPSK